MAIRSGASSIKLPGILLLFLLGLLAPTHEAISQEAVRTRLSRGFDRMDLGMSYTQTLEALVQSSYFEFRGLPDLSLRPGGPDPIIFVEGLSFVDEAYFQFRDDRLYSILILVNLNQMDYFTFYQHFQGLYGDPVSLDPSRSIWEDGATRLILEKPLSIHYLDIPTMEIILEGGRILDSAEEFARDRFLENF